MIVPEEPGASVVVPSFGRPTDLRVCLEALAAQTIAPLEVIVVGRRGESATESVCEAARAQTSLAIELRTTAIPGHLPPLATGVAAARGEVVAFLDDDAEPWEHWLESLLRHYPDPAIGGVGGLISETYEGEPPTSRKVLQIGVSGRFDRLGSTSVPVRWGARPVDVLRGTNMSFRRALLREYRWDARLNRGAGTDYEVDLCCWVARRGYTLVYDPDAIVTHHTGRRPELGREWTPAAVEDYSHNLVYVSGKSLASPRAALALAHTFLVGSRASYGLTTAAIDLVRPHRRKDVAALLGPAIRGKLSGVRSLWSYSRQGPLPLDDEP